MSTSEDETREVTTLNPDFADEVRRQPGGEHINACFQCGTCTAGCPVAEINPDYNPRQIIHKALLGLDEDLLKSETIWLCSMCYTCEERCPQDVRLTDVITALKNLAVERGYVPAGFKKQAELVYQYGRIYEITDFDNKRRSKRMGLPEIEQRAETVRQLFANYKFKKEFEATAEEGEKK
jgi:heterodisulfide reductase subunit C